MKMPNGATAPMTQFINDTQNKFQIVWDLGRRCTYACSYCPPHRNNKFSPLATYDDLVKTMDFVADYVGMYEEYRKVPYRNKTLSFTGGEPTIHNSFFKFARYVNETYPDFTVSMTTNGAFSERVAQECLEILTGGTVSYHPESTPAMKKLVIKNIITLSKNLWRTNVMFHKDYFDECVDVCKQLDEAGVDYTPRRIGDDGGAQWSIDKGYTHVYTEEQEAWFDNYFGASDAKEGRMCCGGRRFCTSTSNASTFLPSTNFKGWSCGVNWYFLFLNSEIRQIYTHQTCGVNLKGKVGPIGSFEDTEQILEELETQLFVEKKLPVITCPKDFCGCGMCIDKAETPALFADVLKPKINELELDYVPEYTGDDHVSVSKIMKSLDNDNKET